MEDFRNLELVFLTLHSSSSKNLQKILFYTSQGILIPGHFLGQSLVMKDTEIILGPSMIKNWKSWGKVAEGKQYRLSGTDFFVLFGRNLKECFNVKKQSIGRRFYSNVHWASLRWSSMLKHCRLYYHDRKIIFESKLSHLCLEQATACLKINVQQLNLM